MENYDEMDTDTESDHLEEDGKPQPMAGFRTGFVSPGKKDRAGFLEEDVPVGLRKSVSAPPILAPMSMCYGAGASGSYNTFPEKTNCVYFQAEIDIESLVDWQQVNESGMWEQNNNYGDMDQAALVNVNNKEVAVFKYGENVIATSSRCPHAGGPLHKGSIEVLPDQSLAVRCPWHKWAFKVGHGHRQYSGFDDDKSVGSGEVVFPPGRDDKKLQVFPTIIDRKRKHIKIGFESVDESMLMNETF